jgi:hypothetical protein
VVGKPVQKHAVMIATWRALAVAFAAAPLALGAAEPTPERSKTQPRKLDLRAPDIREIFTPEQIAERLRNAKDPALEHVEVEALPLDDQPFRDRSERVIEKALRRGVSWLAPSKNATGRPPTEDDRPPPFAQSMYHPSFPPSASRR